MGPACEYQLSLAKPAHQKPMPSLAMHFRQENRHTSRLLRFIQIGEKNLPTSTSFFSLSPHALGLSSSPCTFKMHLHPWNLSLIPSQHEEKIPRIAFPFWDTSLTWSSMQEKNSFCSFFSQMDISGVGWFLCLSIFFSPPLLLLPLAKRRQDSRHDQRVILFSFHNSQLFTCKFSPSCFFFFYPRGKWLGNIRRLHDNMFMILIFHFWHQ